MTDMLHQITLARYRRCALRLLLSADVDDRCTGEALLAFLNGLDPRQAFDLRLERGHHDPRHEERRRHDYERYWNLICLFATVFFPDEHNQAKAAHDSLITYSDRAWENDRTREHVNYRPGSLRDYQYRILSLSGHVPQADTIRRKLKEVPEPARALNAVAASVYSGRAQRRRDRISVRGLESDSPSP
jgi:hypothetical protein